MTDILEGVLIRGTASGHQLSNMACAGKTGTTNDKKDGWFCGYTPYYTTVVWVGYDSPKTLDDLYGSTYPLTIWQDYMEKIHENLEYEDFQSYKGESSINHKSTDSSANSYDTPSETLDPEAVDNTAEPDKTTKPVASKAPTKTQEPAQTAAPTQEPVQTQAPAEDIPNTDQNTEDIPEGAE